MARKKYVGPVMAAAAILIWAALALVGGPLNNLDLGAIQMLAAERLAHPWLTRAGIWASFLGSAEVTLPLTFLAVMFLLWRRRPIHAAVLFAAVLSERVLVEYLKVWIGRPRPDPAFQAAALQSLAFPSGHAANSMTAFVAIALFCAPKPERRVALIAAIGASVLVGLSRPLLGVHWPSDVLGGWIFGLLWAVGGWRIAGRFEIRSA
ncbi:MAG TPA: phosphatase PAP2 family protein [Sphingomicrobium sp.]|nr:phosphatase PAP2 family protein [Sphingomicrobium sp.]